MKKILFILIALLGTVTYAQTGIGTTTPNTNARLEVSATDKGLLMPRIALTGTGNVAPLSAHVAGMTVYNTATAGDVTPGYYVSDGAKWIRMADASMEPWFGTDDNAGATDNTEDIYSLGNVGIGSATLDPSAALDITSSNSGLILPRVANTAAVTTPVNGMIIYDLSQNCFVGYANGAWTDCFSGGSPIITSLDNCASPTTVGSLQNATAASGVSFTINYSGGNGRPYSGETVNSTGVTGVTATLTAGTLATGTGSVTYNITGTPTSTGTASFAISLGGQMCTVDLTVLAENEVIGIAGGIWYNRNVGATQVATSETDVASYGDLYQWGRASDGHESRTSATTTIQSSTDTPGHGDFITDSTLPYDWRNPKNHGLWQGGAGVNNPCPSGYRLATSAEWYEEMSAWPDMSASSAFNSPLKISRAGRRWTGTGVLYNVGTEGQYWTSTISPNNTYGTSFVRLINTTGTVNDGKRSSGLSVRCHKN